MPFAIVSTPAFAQTGRELELPPTDVQRDAPQVRRDDASLAVAPCPFDDPGQPGLAALTAQIDHIRFQRPDGSDIAPELAASLSGVTAPGGVRPLKTICDLRDAANAALRADKWLASVVIPQQELTGTLKLNVVSARITEIRVEGDVGPFAAQLRQRLDALGKLDPLNERDAERALLLANELPGVSLSMSLRPASGAPGDVIGVVAVDYKRWAMFANIRNYNSKRIGRETLYSRFEYYGLTGLSDITYAGFSSTIDFSEQLIAQVGHEFGVGSSGTRVGAALTKAWSKPDIANLDLATDTLIGRLEVSQPLVRTPTLFADATVGFDYIDQKTEIINLPLNRDKIRTFFLRGDVSTRGEQVGGNRRWRASGFAEVRKGTSFFGATGTDARGFAQTDGISASRPFGNAQAWILRGGADAFLSFDRVGLRGRFEGQWANDPLLNFEEYAVGNLTIGRGYDPGANSGDRAVAVSFEGSVNLVKAAKYDVDAYAFYDFVRLENLDPRSPEATRSLDSVGGGLRLFLTKGLSFDLTYARPLKRALFNDAKRPPDRVLFSITAQFPALFR
ncbi:MAG TPA: ShlB/FhaC/HecB family hemolysin secretion/activation protein [Sphingopyxis sp.]|nr:ShlB/FhaC/HecB family hemolysin secretion/activation protein [Sphingopyxis sp.]HMP44767.1 ShlB/FhaC/HecB family hemolysin secretion/activation protein [Sphingopyxis sp.]HMQ19617.1 ShlB/FhaC/HecB family hemolysin secretion/activation protein [Sphingopyxis sp.]